MTLTSIQDKNEFLCFAVFDKNSKQLLYSKYNFDHEKFRNSDINYKNLSKNEIFYEFLIKNETTLLEPFLVKEELKTYFLPITQEIQDYFDDYSYLLWGLNYNKLSSYIADDVIMNNEFDLIQYNYLTQISNLCDFFHIEENIHYLKF